MYLIYQNNLSLMATRGFESKYILIILDREDFFLKLFKF